MYAVTAKSQFPTLSLLIRDLLDNGMWHEGKHYGLVAYPVNPTPTAAPITIVPMVHDEDVYEAIDDDDKADQAAPLPPSTRRPAAPLPASTPSSTRSAPYKRFAGLAQRSAQGDSNEGSVYGQGSARWPQRGDGDVRAVHGTGKGGGAGSDGDANLYGQGKKNNDENMYGLPHNSGSTSDSAEQGRGAQAGFAAASPVSGNDDDMYGNADAVTAAAAGGQQFQAAPHMANATGTNASGGNVGSLPGDEMYGNADAISAAATASSMPVAAAVALPGAQEVYSNADAIAYANEVNATGGTSTQQPEAYEDMNLAENYGGALLPSSTAYPAPAPYEDMSVQLPTERKIISSVAQRGVAYENTQLPMHASLQYEHVTPGLLQPQDAYEDMSDAAVPDANGVVKKKNPYDKMAVTAGGVPVMVRGIVG